jgi:ATP-dependent helicase IRC3
MIGRGLRKSSETGKTDCLLIDIFGSVERGVIVNPSLEGLDPNLIDSCKQKRRNQENRLATEISCFIFIFLIKGSLEDLGKTSDVTSATENVLEEEPQQASSGLVSVNKLTYTDFDSPFRNEPAYKNPGDLYRLTRYSWVACGDGIFVLELLGQGHLRIQAEQEETGSIRYVIYFVRTMQRTDPSNNDASRIFAKPQIIGTAEGIPEAIKTADAFLGQATKSKKIGLSLSIIRSLERRATWRRLPASEQQITIIKKRLGAKLVGDVVQDFDRLDKGQAANLLTRLNHGFKSRLDRQLRQHARIQKNLQRRSKIEIKVGKLVDP